MPLRIGHWLNGVFNLNGLKRFLGKIEPATKEVIHIGIIAVEALKKVMDNPLVDAFEEMEKSGLAKNIIEGAKEWFPRVLLELKLADKCMALTDRAEIIKCGAEVINQFAGDFKSQKLTEIAEQFTVAASDGKVTWNEIAGLVKLVFDTEYNPATPAP